jgi:hypothetical protein
MLSTGDEEELGEAVTGCFGSGGRKRWGCSIAGANVRAPQAQETDTLPEYL